MNFTGGDVTSIPQAIDRVAQTLIASLGYLGRVAALGRQPEEASYSLPGLCCTGRVRPRVF